MARKKNSLHSRLTGLAMVMLAFPVLSQSAAEHASHHPTAAPAADQSAQPASGMGAPTPASASPAPQNPAPAPNAAPGGGMGGGPPGAAAGGGTSGAPGAAPGGGMGEMMKGMGTPPRKELYPTLMAMPDGVTPEMRADIDQRAEEGMKAGAAEMSSGLQKLSDSTYNEDYGAMQQATEQMRAGLADYDAGIAAQQVLSGGKAPRNLALGWFRREMNLASPVPGRQPRSFLGIPLFHLFTMVLLVGFALAMVAMYFFKMRRAAALFGRLGPDVKPAPATAEPKPAEPKPPPPAVPPPGGPPKTPEPGAPPTDVTSPPAGPTKPSAPPSPAEPAKPESPPPDGSPQPAAPPETAEPGAPPAAEGPHSSFSKSPSIPEPASGSPVTANWRGQLRLGSIVTETPSVKTFRLLPSSNDRLLPFTFLPGQFMNVAFWVGGMKMNRSYSISSSPNEREYIELSIRREPRGAVSRHMDDLLKVGDLIEAGGPVGKFVFTGTEEDSVVLIAGGVGVTPMMSIARYLTERSWSGDIFFVYTCRTPADFIFADKVRELERLNPKLHVAVTISQPEGTEWQGNRGRITKEWLTQTVPDFPSRMIHLCGPPPMMDAIKAIAGELGVPSGRLMTEAFGAVKPTLDAPGASAKPTGPATGPLVTFSKNGKTAKIRIDLRKGDSPPKQSILQLSEELSIGIEFSCRVGTCGVCKTKMTSGRVDQEVQDALDDDDKAKGIILACQAKPQGDVTVEA